MKKQILILTMILISGLTFAQNVRKADRWHHFRFLIGTWKMDVPGKVMKTQTYHFMYNGVFLQMKTKETFAPTEKNQKGEVHENLGIFSYDGFRNKVILRSFHSEGFINQYVLESVSKDGKILVFLTENVENTPKGTKAKLEYKKINDNEFTQKFSIKFPNKENTCVSDNHFVRVKK